MFTRFDANKSTKGASKLRRDLINAEIANLRDLLPLPPSTRQRLSQLQLMALVCVYVRKANYFQQAFKRHDMGLHPAPTPNIGFSKALSGFLMMMTQNGKLLYISDNAAEYLGHSMEDLLIHGDSVYDIIDKQDHQAIQAELGRAASTNAAGAVGGGGGGGGDARVLPPSADDSRMFLCRMNVSRNARRQMRFGDQKVVLVRGHYLSFLPLCSRNEPVFLATCTPIAMPETRECVVQGATNVFTSIHSMDMKFIHIDKNGEFHLGYTRAEVQGASWYRFLHWECTRDAQAKHRLITQSEQDRSCILLVRLQRRAGDWLWVHCVLQVKENMENSQQPVIVCTNQVLAEHEAHVMRANGWLYHYYMVHSKLQYGLAAYETHQHPPAHSHPHPHPHPHQHPHPHPHTSPAPAPRMFAYYHGGVPAAHHDTHQPAYPHQPTYLHSPGGTLPHQHQHQHTHQYQQPTHHHHHQNHQHQHQQQSQPQPQPLGSPEPVDYSVHAATELRASPPMPSPAASPAPSAASAPTSASSVTTPVPLYSKRRSRRPGILVPLDLEPLKIESGSVGAGPAGGGGGCAGGCGVLLVPAVLMQHAAARPRLAAKADPADLIDQWNPSPPWSDTLQKVPDVTHQDLSPYVTTTPPTPTGTPGGPHSLHTAFTFDWTQPEQYVPSMSGPRTIADLAADADADAEHYQHFQHQQEQQQHQHHQQQHHHHHHHHHTQYQQYQQPYQQPVSVSAAETTWLSSSAGTLNVPAPRAVPVPVSEHDVDASVAAAAAAAPVSAAAPHRSPIEHGRDST